jgi:hypothetical protein
MRHICQLFDSDESRAESVAAYVEEGLQADEHVLVIARPRHWSAVLDVLRARGVMPNRPAGGRLIVKDAMDMLRRISRGGLPDPACFDEVIGAAVRRLTAVGKVRAYGEMVDILAQRNEMPAALALEQMWNRLGDAAPFALMCAYAAPHFVSVSTHRALRDICAAHSEMQQNSHDALANWLLTAAHTSSDALSH